MRIGKNECISFVHVKVVWWHAPIEDFYTLKGLFLDDLFRSFGVNFYLKSNCLNQRPYMHDNYCFSVITFTCLCKIWSMHGTWELYACTVILSVKQLLLQQRQLSVRRFWSLSEECFIKALISLNVDVTIHFFSSCSHMQLHMAQNKAIKIWPTLMYMFSLHGLIYWGKKS